MYDSTDYTRLSRLRILDLLAKKDYKAVNAIIFDSIRQAAALFGKAIPFSFTKSVMPSTRYSAPNV